MNVLLNTVLFYFQSASSSPAVRHIPLAHTSQLTLKPFFSHSYSDIIGITGGHSKDNMWPRAARVAGVSEHLFYCCTSTVLLCRNSEYECRLHTDSDAIQHNHLPSGPKVCSHYAEVVNKGPRQSVCVCLPCINTSTLYSRPYVCKCMNIFTSCMHRSVHLSVCTSAQQLVKWYFSPLKAGAGCNHLEKIVVVSVTGYVLGFFYCFFFHLSIVDGKGAIKQGPHNQGNPVRLRQMTWSTMSVKIRWNKGVEWRKGEEKGKGKFETQLERVLKLQQQWK